MSSAVVSLVDTPEPLVRDFLSRIGMPPVVAEWRYFDRAFNRGRNRGYVWLRDDRVEGMLGLIPFTASHGSERRAVHWTCDWTLGDPNASPGMGVLLLKTAIQRAGPLMAFGGNANTQRLLPRIAARTFDGAGVAFHLPLRAGVLLRKLEARVRLPAVRGLRMIPLRWVSAPGRARDVTTSDGLAPAIAPLVEETADEAAAGWCPRYDFEYVDWQIGRSPVLSCGTTSAPRTGAPRAAALYWRSREHGDMWRMVFWCRRDAADLGQAVLREAVREVYAHGAAALSVIASRLDVEWHAWLRAAGFFKAQLQRPLYLCSTAEAEPLGELRCLSYLDTDLGFRF